MRRSYLFAPGDNKKLTENAFSTQADVVVLDLEDGVPADRKDMARDMVAETLRLRSAWVRVNAPKTALCDRDLQDVVGLAAGIRVPKVESAEDVRWVAERAPRTPLTCTLETARGVLNVLEIASVDEVQSLTLGTADLARDLNSADGELEMLFARTQLVMASRVAGINPPIDGAYLKLADDDGLRRQTLHARRLGFFGKSAVHPRQIPIINEAFTPTTDELTWARLVVSSFEASGGAPTKLPDGELVDLPVAARARRLIELAKALQ